MAPTASKEKPAFTHLDQAVAEIAAHKDRWAATSLEERIAILDQIKDAILPVAEDWAITASREKQIPAGSPLEGEEWISGPYPLMAACNLFMQTLSAMDGRRFLKKIPVRELHNGQIAASVMPHSIWDRLLLSGVKAEVWMQPGVSKANLAEHTASAYAVAREQRQGKVALVLGAGNIAAIPPLDCFQKLFAEHQVVILKMNPVNEYLDEFLGAALKPLIDFGALRIVRGGVDAGEYLCNHPDIDEIHITGAHTSHDAIVWGAGSEGKRNKARKTPRNSRRITSELGAVCPTIVVPGPWTSADLSFQAENIATQKLHNSGFNCIACQMLVLPGDWDKTDTLLEKIESTMKSAPSRGLYYPGAGDRMADFETHGGGNVVKFARSGELPCVVASHEDGGDAWFENNEIFAPAMSTYRIGEPDAEAYLRKAIAYVNENLHGTLGANVLIHPATMARIGRKKMDAIIADLHYGCIAINCWTGLGFLLVQTPWGAFPGHTLDDVQSGIGFVHNTFMFDKPERTVVEAPFRPFPRNLLSGRMTLLPRPPWFVTNRKQRKIGELLTKFQYRPGWLKLPRIFLNALLG